MNREAAARTTAEAVTAYKAVLKRVLDNRPSGTRHRLALALGKNRSFVSQIANPSYPIPIPAQHLETIFEVCHFSHEDRRVFLDAYGSAHPARLKLVRDARPMRTITLALPDLGDARKNRAIDAIIDDFARHITRLADDLSS
jgi:hypothetical protein